MRTTDGDPWTVASDNHIGCCTGPSHRMLHLTITQAVALAHHTRRCTGPSHTLLHWPITQAVAPHHHTGCCTADADWCGRLIHNQSQEVFYTVQFTAHFLWQKRRCPSLGGVWRAWRAFYPWMMWRVLLELYKPDACNPVVRVGISKPGHQRVFYVTIWSFNRSLTLWMTGFAMNHNQSRPKNRDEVDCKLCRCRSEELRVNQEGERYPRAVLQLLWDVRFSLVAEHGTSRDGADVPWSVCSFPLAWTAYQRDQSVLLMQTLCSEQGKQPRSLSSVSSSSVNPETAT